MDTGLPVAGRLQRADRLGDVGDERFEECANRRPRSRVNNRNGVGKLVVRSESATEEILGLRQRLRNVMFTPEELAPAIPRETDWQLHAEVRERHHQGPDDESMTVCDSVLLATRR